MNIFLSSRLQDYLEFYSKEKSFIESLGKYLSSLFLFFSNLYILGIKHDRNITKMGVLTFFQNVENQKEVTFYIIEKQMQVATNEVYGVKLINLHVKLLLIIKLSVN